MKKSNIILANCPDIESFEVVFSNSSLNLSAYENTLTGYWNDVIEDSNKAGIEVWDGLYYRLENIDELINGAMQLQLSTVPYSTVRSLIKLKQSHNTLDSSYFSYHINTGALISTSDDLFVFGQKTRLSGTQFIDLIGGGLQKDELTVKQVADIKNNILKEAFEEANISSSMIDWVNLNSFVLTNTMSVIILFNIKLNVDKSQLLKAFESRVENELSGLEFFDKLDVGEFSRRENALSYLSLIPQLVKNYSVR